MPALETLPLETLVARSDVITDGNEYMWSVWGIVVLSIGVLIVIIGIIFGCCS